MTADNDNNYQRVREAMKAMNSAMADLTLAERFAAMGLLQVTTIQCVTEDRDKQLEIANVQHSNTLRSLGLDQ